MADSWEVILHHTYRGAPGVVYDSSPIKGAHGVAVGGVKFHPDGQGPDSGSISFRNAASCIHVEATKGWDTLGALKIETVCRFGLAARRGHFQSLIRYRDRFLLGVYGSNPNTRTVHILASVHTGTPQRFGILSPRLPVDEWLTLGVWFNGWDRLELSVDGAVVKTKTSAIGVGPLSGRSPAIIDIGGRGYHRVRFEGRIDEVRISRSNPRAVAEDFLNRPMDSETAECWVRWGRKLLDWLRQNPRCADEFAALVTQMRHTVYAIDRDAELRDMFRRAAETYRKEWRTGLLASDAMVDALVAVSSVIGRSDLPVQASVDLLTASDCWRRLRMEVPVPQCDPQLAQLANVVTETLEEGQGRAHQDADNRH
ncbi:hypothetical protein AFM11_14435 [Mycolicibacterium wolinskyi]|uniref:LamG-like jellyroll fold domain-containing protein n=1 Tax=Mycolicibacterium wolinskyi TaxID=59750 RepID=A0A132PMC9_9MYCO|nr:hypothetical protein [Mycolicibacterium wolinskyi]KWX23475.1 hypothetical protein AFM11_14435 [Mycolicibacterium wolinskyi]